MGNVIFLFKFAVDLHVTAETVQDVRLFSICHSLPPHWKLVLRSPGEPPGESPCHSHACGGVISLDDLG